MTGIVVPSRRKLPSLEPETQPFWTGGARGQLLIQHCDACGHWQHPPLALCRACHAPDVAPRPVSGRGRVVSHTVNRQPWGPQGAEPFIFAAIELEEQAELYVFSNLLAPESAVGNGMAVQVAFERHDDVWLPLFCPAGEAA